MNSPGDSQATSSYDNSNAHRLDLSKGEYIPYGYYPWYQSFLTTFHPPSFDVSQESSRSSHLGRIHRGTLKKGIKYKDDDDDVAANSYGHHQVENSKVYEGDLIQNHRVDLHSHHNQSSMSRIVSSLGQEGSKTTASPKEMKGRQER